MVNGGGAQMTEPVTINGLSEVARFIAKKNHDTFAVILMDNSRIGNILGNLLERAFGISKNRITKLGPTSLAQDAFNLSKQRDIVIAPKAIVANFKPELHPSAEINKIVILDVAGDSAIASYYEKIGNTFAINF